MATERKVGKNSIKPVGQRSISSMFSNPTAGRPNNGRPVSLMEFLNRKSEKRTSSQGCVADAGLTQEVRERLESTRKNDDNIRSNNEQHRASIESSHNINSNESSCVDDSSWPFRRGKALFKDHGDGIGQFQSVEEECSTSRDRDEIATSKAQVGAQARDKSRNRVPPRLEIFGKQGGSSSAVDAGACYSPDNIHKNVDEHHVPETASQSSSVDFIDLTEDEVDPAGEDVDTEIVDHRKRKRPSQAEPGATEICPVCDELFPPHMLRAHVESELDAMEMTEINAVPEAHNVFPAGGHELPHHIGPERSAEPKERGSKSSRSRHTSVLVLGDEPKHRRHNNNKRPVNRSAATFNHYADGGGWWDEGGSGCGRGGCGLSKRVGGAWIHEFWGESCRNIVF